MVSTAPLDMEYANRSFRPISDAIEARLMMEPPFPPLRMDATACWDTKNRPLTFTLYLREDAGERGRSRRGRHVGTS